MKTLMIIILSLSTISCATPKQTTKETPGFIEIRFGSSGGFTAQGKIYLIKNNGEVYTINNDSLTLLNQVDQVVIDNICKQLLDMTFENIEFSEKGNMTYHIEVSTPKYENKVTWTDQSQADNLKELFKALVKTLRKK